MRRVGVLAVLLLVAGAAQAAPFEDCRLNTDFDFSLRMATAAANRTIEACDNFIQQASANARDADTDSRELA